MSSDSTNPTKYNFPYRTNYEAYLLLTWLVAAVIMLALPYIFSLPKSMYHIGTLTCLAIGVLTGFRAVEIHIKISRLKGYPLEFIDPTSKQTLKLFGISKEVIKRVQNNRK